MVVSTLASSTRKYKHEICISTNKKLPSERCKRPLNAGIGIVVESASAQKLFFTQKYDCDSFLALTCIPQTRNRHHNSTDPLGADNLCLQLLRGFYQDLKKCKWNFCYRISTYLLNPAKASTHDTQEVTHLGKRKFLLQQQTQRGQPQIKR